MNYSKHILIIKKNIFIIKIYFQRWQALHVLQPWISFTTLVASLLTLTLIKYCKKKIRLFP